jgi:UTP:GlnB (protein PII) uridylyltransferase
VRHRQDDPFELDASQSLRWTLVERLHEMAVEGGDPVAAAEHRQLAHPEWLLLAALLVDSAGDGPDEPVAAARRLVLRLGLGAGAEEEVALLVGERNLLRAAIQRLDGLAEENVLRIATHLDKPERARALYLLSAAVGGLEPWERERLDDLHALVQASLARPDLTGLQARNLVEARRQSALRLLGEGPAAAALGLAPRSWIVAHEPKALARHAELVARRPTVGGPLVVVASAGEGLARIDVSAKDSPGLLARSAAALSEAGIDVVEAGAAVWGRDGAIQTFLVRSAVPPDPDALRQRFLHAAHQPPSAVAARGARITWDDESSPWTTVCTIEAPDRTGLLAALASAFARAGAEVQSARATTTVEGTVRDLFEVTSRRGEKLHDAEKAQVEAALAGEAPLRTGLRVPMVRSRLRARKPAPLPET